MLGTMSNPQKQMFVPEESLVQDLGLSNVRCTYFDECAPEGGAEIQWDHITDRKRTPSLWTGVTYLFTKQCGHPKLALAGVTRDKGSAKKAARSQNFSYLDQLHNTNACMTKPVTVVTYDMEPFLKSCVDRYVALAGKNAIEFLSVLPGVHVAIEWPRGCTYWGLPKVKRLIERLGLVPYHFDGCAVGLKGKDNLPIKKPWTVATTHEEIGKALSEFQCSCNMQHAEGRGKFLRETQSYTYVMTDAIHAAFRSRSQAISTCCIAALIRPADMKHMAVNFVPQVEPAVMPTVRDRIAAWEKVSTDLRAACVKVAFGEDPEAHVRRLASIRQPIGVAIRGTIGGGSAQGSFGEMPI